MNTCMKGNGVAKVWGAVVLLAAAGMLGTLATGATSTVGSAPVTVVNTPLPVALQGTGTITGQVSAAQSGLWSVGVTSLPAVQLAPGTTVSLGGGTVALDDPAKEAYAVTLCASNLGDCGPAPSAVTLPVGKRFVIEYTSGTCYVRNTGIHGWILTARLNGQDFGYHISDKISAHDDESTVGLFSNTVQIYADGGVPNGLSASLDLAGFTEDHDLGPSDSCDITLSGRLIQVQQF
jgi:hypothetical protein